jgi:hypothetical protein
MINVNEVVSIKTTQEPVFVLAISNGLVTVRRPVMGNDGVKHLTEEFTLAELETEADRIERNYKEKQALQSRVFGDDNPNMVKTIGSAN